jgi:hypothetical protein
MDLIFALHLLFWLGAPDYPAARKLCSEEVVGNGMRISFSTYAVADEPARVVAFYEKQLGAKARPEAAGSWDFDLPADPKNAKMSIYPAARAGDFPHCQQAPAARDKTVILVSRALR